MSPYVRPRIFVMACGVTPSARATSARLIPPAIASRIASARSWPRRAIAARWDSIWAAARRARASGSDGIVAGSELPLGPGDAVLVPLGLTPLCEGEGLGLADGAGPAVVGGEVVELKVGAVRCHVTTLLHPRLNVNGGVKLS